MDAKLGRSGRAVEGTGLENQQRLTAFVGSNPTSSTWKDAAFVK